MSVLMQSMAVPGVAKIQGKGAVLIQVCGVRIMAAVAALAKQLGACPLAPFFALHHIPCFALDSRCWLQMAEYTLRLQPC